MEASSDAERWMAAVSTIQPHEHVQPVAILSQAARKERPTPVGLDGQLWSFWDGSTLTINSQGMWATRPAVVAPRNG